MIQVARECAECGGAMAGKRPNARYCSERCKYAGRYRRNRETILARNNATAARKRVARGPRICQRCDRPTITPHHRYCAGCRVKVAEQRLARRYRRGMTPEQLERAKERDR